MKQEIIVTINPDGSTSVETKGYVGKSCKDASKFIEDALGKVESDKLKPEYHQQATSGNRIQQKG